MTNEVFTLEKNAVDSLEEALNFFEQCEVKPNKIRISILLLDNFLELFLKSYICCTHPLLIFQKPSANDLKTVTLSESIIVIKKIGYVLEGVFEQQIINLRKLRNELQHHEAKFDSEDWKVKIGEILYYALNFDEQNNNLFNIESYIAPNKWSEIINLKSVFEKHMESSIKEAREAFYYGPHDDEPTNPQPLCPICGIDGTTHIEDEHESAYCHFCRVSFSIQQCGRCGEEKSIDAFSEDEEGNISMDCNDCWEKLISKD